MQFTVHAVYCTCSLLYMQFTSNFFAEAYKISEVLGYDKRELSHKIMPIHIGKYGSCFLYFIATPNTTKLSHRNAASAVTSGQYYSVHDSYNRRYVTCKNYVIEMCRWRGSKALHTQHQNVKPAIPRAMVCSGT